MIKDGDYWITKSNLLDLKKYYIAPRYPQTQTPGHPAFQTLYSNIFENLETYRYPNNSALLFWGVCSDCQLLLQLFLISNSILSDFHFQPLLATMPFTNELKRPLISRCSSSVMLLLKHFFSNRKRRRKSSSLRYGLHLWLFSRWRPVLQC